MRYDAWFCVLVSVIVAFLSVSDNSFVVGTSSPSSIPSQVLDARLKCGSLPLPIFPIEVKFRGVAAETPTQQYPATLIASRRLVHSDQRVAFPESSTGTQPADACRSSCRSRGLERTVSIRIVLADPHPLIMAGLQHLVHREADFHVVACCRDSEEILRAVHQHRPDVLILDFHLPGKAGAVVLQELAQQAAPVRVVLLTAALDANEALQACRLGVRGVVLKEMADQFLAPCIRKVHAGEHWIEHRSISQALEKLLQREAGGRELAQILTQREREIVHWVGCGLQNREIAEKLTISEGTVKIHLHRIYHKLQVPNRLALLHYVYAQGVL
jgi:DNA-binding NarL/FixJ family response regulator